MKNVFREVHTRSLWQVLGLYLAVSWVVLQVVDVLADNVALPDWVFPIALVLLLVGLPVVLGTAFVQGGVRNADSDPEHGRGQDTGRREAASPSGASARSGLLTWRNALLGGLAAFGLLGLGIGGWVGLRAAGIGGAGTLVAKGMLDDRAEVVISDFLASGAEPSLARTLTEAFRIDFTESPTVRVVDPSRVSETLRLMERDPEEGLTLDLARELAQREGFPAVIAGEIGMAGANYLLTGQVVSAADGAVLVSHRETASEEDLLDAIDALSQRLRERIGEPLGSLAGAAPLERVTTSSFEALDKYSEAERLMITGGSRTRAVSLLEEAIELDATFAMAHRKLGISLFILQEQRARQVESFTRAFELRDRLTDYERYITEGSYYTYATGELDRAVTAYENALAIDSVGPALNNLAIVYQALGDHERALDMFALDIAQDRLSSNPYVNSLFSLVSLSRPDDMRARFEEMYGLFPTASSHSWGAQAFLSVGDYATADSHIAALEEETGSPDWQSQARLLGAMSRGARGNLERGLELLAERAEIEAERDLEGGVWESEELAARLLLGLKGDADAALARLEQAAAVVPVSDLSPYDRPYSALAVANAEAGRVAEARRYAEAFEEEIWPLASGDLGIRLDYRAARGAVAEAVGDFAAAIEEYRQTPEAWCPECTNRLLGRAFDRWGRADSALVYLERAASVPSGSRGYGDSDWIGRTTLRVAELHDQANNLSDAARFYAAFVELWADADPEFQPEVAAAQDRLEVILREIG
jgi:tetratricopeptide (TPR) repeat protein